MKFYVKIIFKTVTSKLQMLDRATKEASVSGLTAIHSHR